MGLLRFFCNARWAWLSPIRWVVSFFSNEIFSVFSQLYFKSNGSQPANTSFKAMSIILKMDAFSKELKITTSSIRFKNSGENVLLSAFYITFLLYSSDESALLCSKAYALTKIFQIARTNIGCHDDKGGFKIHFSSHAICKYSIVKYLQ